MYRWLKDGIPVTDFSTGQYYRIPNTRRDDAGSYQCMARNDAGTIFSEKIDVVVACKLAIFYIDVNICSLKLISTLKFWHSMSNENELNFGG